MDTVSSAGRRASHPIRPSPPMNLVALKPGADAAPPAAPGDDGTRSLRLDARGPSTVRADTSIERREQLERELDRVQATLLAERANYGRSASWLLLAQMLLLNAFVVALVFGAAAQVPNGRLLLAGIAIFGAVSAGLMLLIMHSLREDLLAFGQQRKLLEATLQRDFGRPPLFATTALTARALAFFSAGLLPALVVAGWTALTVYTLVALPAPAAASAAPTAAPAANATAGRVTGV